MDIINQIDAFGKDSFFTYGVITTLILSIVFLSSAYIIVKIIKRYVQKKNLINEAFIMRMVRIVFYTLAIYACLSMLKPFDSILSTIWGSAGILAVVVGLAAQESLGNIVNGLLITTFKPFHIGDLVKVDQGEYEGFVIDISLRHTVILTYENTKIIIPNSVMNKAVLENVSTSTSKANFLFIQISYESNLDRAIEIIVEEAIKHPYFMDVRSEEEQNLPPVIVRVQDFLDNGIQLKATIHTENKALGVELCSDLRRTIKKRFDQEGIEFPYPHRTIVYKNKSNE